MSGLGDAFRLLTVLPIGRGALVAPERHARCASWFPVVGAAIGGGVGAAALGASRILPPEVAAALITLLGVAVSGGLHMDGLADTADGLFGGRDRASMLNIMKDSRVGTMGVLAIVAVCLLKYAGLGSLPPALMWQGAAIAPFLGRCAILAAAAAARPATPGQGLGSAFFSAHRPWKAAPAAVVGALGAWGLLPHHSLYIIIGVGCVVLWAVWFLSKKLGGLTGDSLGAVCELAETAAILLLVSSHTLSA